MGKIVARIKNLEQFQKDLEAIRGAGEKAVTNTVNDTKRRAPGWVASEVTKKYGIKKGEIMPASKSAKKPQRKAGSARVNGETISNMTLEYRGRVLTPTHFNMKPRKRPKLPYEVTAEIFKGRRRNLGSKVFLGSNKGTGHIPFKRKGRKRTPIEAVKSLSLPQMVDNPNVRANIEEQLNKGVEERLRHNMDRALGRGR